MKPELAICFMISILLISGCLEQGSNNKSMNEHAVNVEKYSETTQGGMTVTVYKSPDSKTWATVFKDMQPTDFSEKGLIQEIYKVIVNSEGVDLTNPPKSYMIDGHTAISTKIVQVTKEDKLPTNNVPDLYVTIISYPEKNTILSITSNGNNMGWDAQEYLVNKFKL